ncbi:Proton-coupled amino acid transporter 1 [Hordeum vulgare]|nr:Proton-coupled amino acid transporter 1 [Hordeum vulgare]
MQYEQLLHRDTEALRLEEEEEERACLTAMPPQRQTPEEDAVVAYQAAFSWVGPPPVFIDLTDGEGDGGKGKIKADCRDKSWEQETEEDVLGDEQSRHGDGDNYTYDDLSDRCFDTIGRHFTQAIIVGRHLTKDITVLCHTGGTLAYLVFISQNINSVLPALKPSTVTRSFVRSLSALAPLKHSPVALVVMEEEGDRWWMELEDDMTR